MRVAFQARIEPGTYDVGPQTIGHRDAIDPLFPNSKLEWSTARRGVSMLVGLLVKVEDMVESGVARVLSTLSEWEEPAEQTGMILKLQNCAFRSIRPEFVEYFSY